MREAGDEGHFFIFQGDLEEIDESERAMGWDTYHVNIDDEETNYGGIVRCVMDRESLRIEFSPEAADALDTSELSLALELTDAELSEAARYLRMILLSGRASEHPELLISGIE